MPAAPRVVYATRGERPVSVHVRPAELPIVVIPGIMGSRLTDPRTDELVWNPMGIPLGEGPGIFQADPDRLSQASASLVPDETHPYELASHHRQVSHIKHYYNLIPDFYGALARYLAAMQNATLTELHLTPRVYCCGYDWRQDNARSAARLASVVDEALRETGARQVIIVAHSMGGLVARYYCRVLGGESKVHQLVLLASPTMGSPAAYAQTRRGLYGIYFRDLVKAARDGDDEVLVEEGIESGMQALSGIGHIGHAGAGGIASTLGDLMLAMSFGSGRFFSREESRYFARQIPAIYQLLPSSVFCHHHPNWVVFDPMATGHRPTGFMVQLPTAFDSVLGVLTGSAPSLSSGAERVAAQFADALEKAKESGESAEVSGRALRNSMTMPEWAAALEKHLTAMEFGEAVGLLLELFEQSKRGFIDGRSNRALYTDIYAGLLDVPSLRALTASNLETALAFDRALTVDHTERAPISLFEMLKTAFSALLPKMGDSGKKSREEMLKEEMKNIVQAALDAHPPKVYMHPRTTNIYGAGVQGDGGAVLIPKAVISRDDTNLVKVQYLPRPGVLGLPLSSGDGTVPEVSANPPNAWLSHPFVGEPICINHRGHNEVPADAETHAAIEKAIVEQLVHYPRG